MKPENDANLEYPLDDLEKEVSGMKVETGQDFLAWLPLAARLAALGRQEPLRQTARIARGILAVEQLIKDRCKEGVWELRNALGDDLGMAVVAAQDFYCAYKLAPEGSIPSEASPGLEGWFEEAEYTTLDSEAVSFIEAYLQKFPIPGELRLAIVDSPTTELEDGLAAAAAARNLEQRPVVALSWGARFEPGLAMAADTGSLTDSIRNAFERLDREFHIPRCGAVMVSRRIDDAGDIVIDITRSDGKPLEIESVRFGALVGERPDAEYPSRWVVKMADLPLKIRLNSLKSALSIVMEDGTIARIE